jgi:hypothetical protein
MDEESGLARLGQDGHPFGDVYIVEKSSVVEGKSKLSIYDSLKSEVSAKRPVLEVQSLKWWTFCSSSVLKVLVLLGE